MDFDQGAEADMSEKILTLHPEEGKAGVNIDRAKYDTIRDAILRVLAREDAVRFMDLTDLVSAELAAFEGSVGWYVVTVKLDLEARGVIERVPQRKPQILRMTAQG